MGQIGIPMFPLQELKSYQFRFRDLFNNNSIHPTWRQHKGTSDLTHKHIIEANGRLSLEIENGYNGYYDINYNQAPKILTNIITIPCEIKTRLDVASIGDDTFAGILLSYTIAQYGSKQHYGFGRYRRDALTCNGLAVVRHSYNRLDYITPALDLPVWLKILLKTTGYYSLSATFSYSYDGLNYTDLCILEGEQESCWPTSSPYGLVGLYCVNGINLEDGGTKNGVSASFDHFLMKPVSPD